MREKPICKKQNRLLRFFLFRFGLKQHRFWNGRFKRVMVWKHKYYLGLLHWHLNNLDKARELFQQCGTEPDFAGFLRGKSKSDG